MDVLHYFSPPIIPSITTTCDDDDTEDEQLDGGSHEAAAAASISARNRNHISEECKAAIRRWADRRRISNVNMNHAVDQMAADTTVVDALLMLLESS